MPGRISGTLTANASKSAMQRACATALVCLRPTLIHNPGHSNDDNAALAIITQLGARIQAQPNGSLLIQGVGAQVLPLLDANGLGQLDCGESGLSIRMFTPLAALSAWPVMVSGRGSLITRPMDFFDETLPQLGVACQSQQGKLPLRIQGPLVPANITVDGSLSSQFLTGLLMAYSAVGACGVTITVSNLKSRPYIDLTLQLLQSFGLKLPINHQYERFEYTAEPFEPVAQPLPLDYTVEGDWSGAAFLLVAAAVAGSIRLQGLWAHSKQADKKIVEALKSAGAAITVEADAVEVAKKMLVGFSFDATDCPDLFPPLVALAANCTGLTRLKGLGRLKHKESDRGVTLQQEFAKLGVKITLGQDDIMLVHGTGLISVQEPQLHSHHDHRIAMAAAVAALTATSAVSISHANAIDKSYPMFYQHLKQLGATVLENN
ncbi:MAG: 3-phosphoshikimate 1-carboxyvinyltransferase [Bacteroidetes bacterium]|nr:MAG: 3-phosphoshikimate 1-carboxyvinyltransferase [Bacteroidota bacterium]